MLLSGQESRNQFNHQMLTHETLTLLNNMFGLSLEHIPHGDTLAHLWKKLDVQELERLKLAMIRTLIRRKLLDKFRFKGRFVLAVDGVEIYRFQERHCEHCLYGKTGKSEQAQYFHRVLEMKLISSCGLSLSLASEMIENPSTQEDKQDCELKAFHRLATKVKKMFPQLPITLLGDGLYPNGPIFNLCQQFNWKFIFVLKDTCLASIWEDFESLFNMPLNALGVKDKEPIALKNQCLYRWQNNLFYQGKLFSGTLNVMDVSKLHQSTGEFKRTRAFITNYSLNENNLLSFEIIGQQRWKIENQGFDVQKHHGYALEHTYCHDYNAMKVVYQLIQIAHLINQLILKMDLLNCFNQAKSCLKTYLKYFQMALQQQWDESWKTDWLLLMSKKIQIRWVE